MTTVEENARWQAAIDGLLRVSRDVSETPARRSRAYQALLDAQRGSGSAACLLGVTGRGHQHHTSGDGGFLRVHGAEQGWWD